MWMTQGKKSIYQKTIILFVFCLLVQYEHDIKYKDMCLKRSEIALRRRKKNRVRWDDVSSRMSKYQFRRMFRMSINCFEELCQTIICAIGEKKFKSQHYIDAFLVDKSSIYEANRLATGGYVSGEIKLAVTIRLLAGGDALDLAVIFDIYPTHILKIFEEVLSEWIIDPNLGQMDILKYLCDKDAMARVSHGFSKRSNGVLKGVIGAIDGWLVKIRRPNHHCDDITNAVPYFSRKGYYALNVQCIVDDRKKVLWAKFNNKGASHDSTCFKHSELYATLYEIRDSLFHEQLFFIGDSAYGIESFLIPPYDLAPSRSPQDDFNFFHSSARITVECAFGEIDLRWGIFWKRLCCSVDMNMLICEGAMHLHNFLVSYRDDHNEDYAYERRVYENDCHDNGYTSEVIGNDSLRIAGRPSANVETSRIGGIYIRDKLNQSIQHHDMHRPRLADT